jgi:hypothetical protein
MNETITRVPADDRAHAPTQATPREARTLAEHIVEVISDSGEGA